MIISDTAQLDKPTIFVLVENLLTFQASFSGKNT